MKLFCFATALSIVALRGIAMERIDPDAPLPNGVGWDRAEKGLSCMGCIPSSIEKSELPPMREFEENLERNGWVQDCTLLKDGTLIGLSRFHCKSCPDRIQLCRYAPNEFVAAGMGRLIPKLLKDQAMVIGFELPYNGTMPTEAVDLFRSNQAKLGYVYSDDELFKKKFQIGFGVTLGRTNGTPSDVQSLFMQNIERVLNREEIENTGIEGSFNMTLRDRKGVLRAVGSVHITPNYVAGKMIGYAEGNKAQVTKKLGNMKLMIELQVLLALALGKKFLSSGPYSSICPAVKYKFNLPGSEILRFNPDGSMEYRAARVLGGMRK